MQTKWAGKNLHYYECIESTNTTLAGLAMQGACHGTLVVADRQTAGRGRRGRSWESPAGKNVYFSLLLRPAFTPDKASMLTLVMACAVTRGIEQVLGENAGMAADFLELSKPQIKWPNDILLNQKKICGILTELHISPGNADEYSVIVGVGINVKAQEFPEDIAGKAGSIEELTGVSLSRKRLTQSIMSAFETCYELFEADGDLSLLMDEYNGRLINKDSQVKVLDPKGEFTGVARGINAAGELLVELPDGSVTAVYAGEVSVRGTCGYV